MLRDLSIPYIALQGACRQQGQGISSWNSALYQEGLRRASGSLSTCLTRNSSSVLFSHVRITRVQAAANLVHLMSRQGLNDMNENAGVINIYPSISKGREGTAWVQSASSKVVREQAMNFHVCTKECVLCSHGEINWNQNIPNCNEVLIPWEVSVDSAQWIPALRTSLLLISSHG